MLTAGPREVPELEIWERSPSTLRNINGGLSGGAGAESLGAPTINAKKHRRRAEMSSVDPREVLELEVWERPPSMLRNIDSG
jgi:hypothetical protein